MTATFQTIDTSDGPFTVITNDAGKVMASGWTSSVEDTASRIRPAHRPSDLMEGTVDAVSAVEAYYAGDAHALDAVEVELHGTDGQLAGWAALRQIKPGQPLNYSQFARALGSPSAVRAAASICARNPAALFVPCHRVLRTDGSLGGFAWGLDIKQNLLDREARA